MAADARAVTADEGDTLVIPECAQALVRGWAGHRLLALAWPDVGHQIVRYSRLPDDATVTTN